MSLPGMSRQDRYERLIEQMTETGHREPVGFYVCANCLAEVRQDLRACPLCSQERA